MFGKLTQFSTGKQIQKGDNAMATDNPRIAIYLSPELARIIKHAAIDADQSATKWLIQAALERLAREQLPTPAEKEE